VVSSQQERRVRCTLRLLFALCATVESQQQKKVPRIGYLGGPPPLLERRAKLSGKGSANLGTSREKTLSLSGDLERVNPNVSLRSQPS
jgi:hypothetical protein